MPKILIAVLLAVFASFLLGRWTPLREVQSLRAELDQLRKTAAKNPGGRSGGMDSVTRMLRIPDNERPVETSAPAAETDPAATPPPATPAAGLPKEPRASLRERLAEAEELWQVRSDLLRESFLSRLPRKGHHVERDFDVLVTAMNLRVDSTVSNWVQKVQTQGEMRPEDGARLAHEVLGSLLLTYEAMDEKLPENWREAAGPEFQLFDMLDPKAGRHFLEIEGMIQEREALRPRGRRVP